MNVSSLCRPLLILAGFALLPFGNLAGAEPPLRAARLGYVSGTVSFSPAGEGDWLRAVVNRPLTRGDRLWVDAGSRAELQFGGTAIRLGAATSVTLLNLDDRMAQVQLTQGTLKVRVRRMGSNQSLEVNTPNLAFIVTRPGDYRIEVDPDGDATAVRVLSGRAELYGDGASYAVSTQQGYRFYGSGLSDYDRLAVRRDDELDRWARDRDRGADNSPSARYVSGDVVGYQDLDAYGSWRRDPEYGNVWAPKRVSADWAPFRDGHWSWIDPWGWTWVDDAPWGYAVSHYGRWANRGGTWVWVPGPQREQAVYAPAQVAFVGGQNLRGSSAGVAVAAALIGWFALAPREVYQPSYPVSRGYFDRINRSNAVVAPSSVTNIYNTTVVNQTTNVTQAYANRRVRGGVVAVPAQAFTQSQPVAKASVQVSSEAAAKAPVANAAPVAPVQQSVQGGAPAAGAKPTHRERRVVARTAPPPPPPAFAAQQPQLAARPGRPIDDEKRKEMKPAAAAPAPAVTVVAPTQAQAPTAPPPATAPAPKSREERRAESSKADSARPDGRGEGRRADSAKGDTAKADAAKADAAKADAAKADAAKADAAKADAAKADAAKGEMAKRDAAKAEAAKADAAKAEAARADAAKADAAKGEAAKRDAAKADAARADAAKADAAKAEAARADAAKADAAKGEAARKDRREAAKADAAKGEAAKADAAKADAAKGEERRRDAAKGEERRRDAEKADQAKGDAMKVEAARAAAARNEAARAEAAKAQAAQAEAAKAQAAQAEAAKAQAAQAAAAKAQAAQAEAAKAQAAQAAAAKAQAAQAEAAKAQAAQAEAAKAQAAQAEAAKAQAAQAAAAKAEGAKAEAAKTEAAKVAAAKAEAAKVEAAKAEAAKATGARAAAVKGDLSDEDKAARKAAREARKADKADDEKK